MMLLSDTSTQWLEIPAKIQTESWQQSQSLLLPGHRWQAYLNRVCVQTILPWLQEKASLEPMLTSSDDPGFWECVNGSAIALGQTRLIVVPTEAMDRSELRVPQEWVDIPNWVGDYYLAVEVDADAQHLHIWGYTTHHQLKSQGHYDTGDRAYCLDGEAVCQDLTVFWVMYQLASEPTRSTVSPLASLSAAAAAACVQTLGNPAIVFPRLEAPFAQWGALLQQDQWFQRLRQQRQGQPPSQGAIDLPLPVVNLSQWLQQRFETGWQAIADLLGAEPDLAFSFRQTDRQGDAVADTLRRAKRIQLASDLPAMLLVVTLQTEADAGMRILVQLLPWTGDDYLPATVQLSLLTQTGEMLQSVQASSHSNYIQLRRFKCQPGTQFRLQVAIATLGYTEAFVS